MSGGEPEGDLLRRFERIAKNDRGRFKPMAAIVDVLDRKIAKSYCGTVCDWDFEIGRALHEGNSNFHAQITAAVNRGKDLCESLIEDTLFPHLVAQGYDRFVYNPTVLLAGEQANYVPFTVAVIPQLTIGVYRADFALAASRGGKIRFVVVECDGKEFHDGVREVVRDVNRDARLLTYERVLDVVRLSGAEIMKNPGQAAAQASKALTWAWTKSNTANDAKFATDPPGQHKPPEGLLYGSPVFTDAQLVKRALGEELLAYVEQMGFEVSRDGSIVKSDVECAI